MIPENIIATNNCLLDISGNTIKVRNLTSDYFNFNYTPFDYDEDAECPLWVDKFLPEVFTTMSLSSTKTDFNDESGEWEEGYVEEPDIVTASILQEFMGYLLTPDTRHQKILGIVGQKRSGKGTIGRVIKDLIGHSNCTYPTLVNLTTEFGMQSLINKNIALIGDANISSRGGDISRAVERLKSISGEDPQQVNRKNAPHVDIGRLPIRFVIMANELQNLIDPSGALASRFIYICTTNCFLGREDKTLYERLQGELSGILNWAIKGLFRLRKRGYFLESESGLAMKNDFIELSSPIIAFVRRCCILDDKLETYAETLYQVYCNWCEKNNRGKASSQKFRNDLHASCPSINKMRKRSSGDRVYVYSGIGLAPEFANADFADEDPQKYL